MKTTILLLLATILIGSAFAEPGEALDACNCKIFPIYIFNDPDGTGGVLTAPFNTGDTINTGCPEDLYTSSSPDTTWQIHYPDTLPFSSIYNRLVTLYGLEDYLIPGDSCWNTAGIPDSVSIPPGYDPTCCFLGIYAKARMFDVASDEYSPWIDVNTTNGIGVVSSPPYLLILINTGNFKSRDLSDNMQFDCCDGDSLFVYVWDCYDEIHMGILYYEFAILARLFANAGEIDRGDTIVLNGLYMSIDEGDNFPKEYVLEQNTPNPFNARTTIRYALPENAAVEIEITNVLGNRVRTLIDGYQTAGHKSVVWDGLDDSKNPLPGGVYFYTVRANDFTARRRAILMK